MWSCRKTRRFETGHLYQGEFRGKRYPCKLGSASAEHRIVCEAGAERLGVYLIPVPRPKRFLTSQTDALKQPLFLPWQEIACRPGRIFFSRIIWFRLDAQKTYYFVPQALGLQLLRDAGRSAPE